MSNLLNFKHLRYFWAVAHQGNLTRAAEALNVSQSALSIQIQKLEQQLGQDLFERRGKRLHLTEAGRIALDHANMIFAAGDELVGTLSQNKPGQRQVLRVGAEATLSRNFQMAFLRPLVGRNDVRVTLDSGPIELLFRALEAHRLDVILTNQPPPRDGESNLVVHELARQSLAVLAKPTDQIRDGEPIEEILARHPLLLPGRTTPMRQRLETFFNQKSITPQIAAEVDDMAMLRLLVREGTGMAVLPPIVVRDELTSGLLWKVGYIPGVDEEFHAVLLKRRFPNEVLSELLEAAFATPLTGAAHE